MSAGEWSDRVRAGVDRWFEPIVVVLLVVTIVSGWGVASAAFDGEVETSGEFQHSATVQEDNPLFSTGTELTDRSVYFTNITPELDGEFVHSHSGSEAYVVETQLSVRTQAVDSDDEVVWAVSRELETDETVLEPDEAHSVPFAVDVQSETARIGAIEELLGEGAGNGQLVVVARTTVMTDEGVVVGTDEHELPIELSGSTYEIDQGVEGFESIPLDTETVQFLGTLALFLGSGALLSGIVVARKRNLLAPRTIEPLSAEQRERKRFDDWISRGRLPKQYAQKSRVDVDSLRDLVDVAIDCDRRVIEDRTRGRYYVIDGNTIYAYSPAKTLSAGGEDGEESKAAATVEEQ